MKQFLLFKFSKTKPRGGWRDFINDFPTLKDIFRAITLIPDDKEEMVEIIDAATKRTLKSFSREEVKIIDKMGAEPIKIKTATGAVLEIGVEHFFYVFFAKTIK